MTELNELAEQMVDRARAASREGELIALALCERDELDQIFCRHRGMQQLGLHWTTVHYKGTAPAISDLIGGHVQFSIDQISSSLSLIRDGRVRALAVSSAKRLAWLPDVPTFVEHWYKNLEAYTFVAVLAPAGTPGGIVRRLAAAVSHAVHDPDAARQIETLGAAAEAMAPEDFRAYLEKEDAVWLPVVRNLSRSQ